MFLKIEKRKNRFLKKQKHDFKNQEIEKSIFKIQFSSGKSIDNRKKSIYWPAWTHGQQRTTRKPSRPKRKIRKTYREVQESESQLLVGGRPIGHLLQDS